MSLFLEVEFTGGTKGLKTTDRLLSIAWTNLCEKHSRGLSVDAIRTILSLSYDLETCVDTVPSTITYQLEEVFNLACDGAALFPDDYPDWETLDLSLCERGSKGGLILSWDGHVLVTKLKNEIDRVYKSELFRIKSNEYIHPLFY